MMGMAGICREHYGNKLKSIPFFSEDTGEICCKTLMNFLTGLLYNWLKVLMFLTHLSLWDLLDSVSVMKYIKTRLSGFVSH